MGKRSQSDTEAAEVVIDVPAPDGDHELFELRRARTKCGVPVEFMRAPKCRPAGMRRQVVGEVQREWKPPIFATLCPIARGYCDHAPGGDDLLVWYRSHGTARCAEVALWLAYRISAAGWDMPALSAYIVIQWAMRRVQAGRTRIQPRPPHDMGETQFERVLSDLSAWLRAGIVDAEYRHWQVTDPAVETPAVRHNGSRASHPVHYPARGNIFVRKAREPAEETPCVFDCAA